MADHTSAFARFSIGRRATLFRDRLALPCYFVEPAVLAIDFVLVVCAGVIAGTGYQWIFLNRLPDPGPFPIPDHTLQSARLALSRENAPTVYEPNCSS
jgi:hypothetical protein